jgi:hypothetical protein
MSLGLAGLSLPIRRSSGIPGWPAVGVWPYVAGVDSGIRPDIARVAVASTRTPEVPNMSTPARPRFHRLAWPARATLALVVTLVAAPSAAGQSAEQVMERMQELDIAFVGIATDIRDRQNLGSRDAPRGPVVYAWDAERTADDAVSREFLLSVENLQAAGIPAIHGASLEFENGMFGNSRYRMGGTLRAIDIRGDVGYEVKVNLDWQLYDARSSSVVWQGSSSSRKRGTSLGVRGEPDNVLLTCVLGALDSVLDGEVADVVGRD